MSLNSIFIYCFVKVEYILKPLLFIGLCVPLLFNKIHAIHSENALKILLIHSGHSTNPWQMSVERGMRSALAASNSELEIYSEQLDGFRFSGEKNSSAFAHFIQQKYSESNIGFLVTEGIGAAQFVEDSEWLFPLAKRLYINPGTQIETSMLSNSNSNSKKNSYIPVNQDYFSSLLAALQLYPTSNLIVVGENTTVSGINRLKAIKQAILDIQIKLRHKEKKFEVNYLLNLSMVELISRVGQLDSRDLIYYLPIHHDGNNRIVPYKAAEQIAAAAAAPVFSNWEVLLGSGIVGGYILSGDKVGEIAIASLNKLLNDQTIKLSENNGYGFYYDWAQLQRWEIDEGNLPLNATVRNRTPSFYQTYFWLINVTLSALVIFFVLTLLLGRINNGRKHAIKALSKERELLEHNVKIRTRDLNEAKKAAEALARCDPLTGINNRRAFFEKSAEAFVMAKRYMQSLSVVMIDIDLFKQINDQYGHATGDQVIKSLADLVEYWRRETDIFGRLGGEEFGLVMPQTNLAQARLAAERLRMAIEQLELTVSCEIINLTASFGIAELTASDEDISQTLDNADKALYEAKKTGRNKVALPPASN
jgi:diguanylate cyclase (GGDEF)-like protein